MRTINIANSNNRDAMVGFDIRRTKVEVINVLPDGQQPVNSRALKSTIDTEPDDLIQHYGGLEQLAQAIIEDDPEIDMEQVGMQLTGTKRVYIGEDEKLVFRLKREEVIYSPDGQEKDVRAVPVVEANIADPNAPVKMTGKIIPKSKAIRMFAFTRKYQIKHVSGLTYDFLYDMARQLAEKNAVMLVGGGPKGASPLVLSDGGVSYRAFLEGRIDGDKYCLILHLTNLELKSVL